MTALLDRLQPYFWEWLAKRRAGEEGCKLAARKRSATLHIIGEGLDKNGYIALVSKVRSALAPAGFHLDRILDWVGKIAADGTIEGEADEYTLPPLGTPLVAPEVYLLSSAPEASEGGVEQDAQVPERVNPPASSAKRSDRPKLDFGGGKGKAAKSDGGKAGAQKSGNGKRNPSRKNGKRRG